MLVMLGMYSPLPLKASGKLDLLDVTRIIQAKGFLGLKDIACQTLTAPVDHRVFTTEFRIGTGREAQLVLIFEEESYDSRLKELGQLRDQGQKISFFTLELFPGEILKPLDPRPGFDTNCI